MGPQPRRPDHLFPSPSRHQTASAVCRQPSLTGAIVFRIPFGLTEFVGDYLMPTHPGIQPASSNTIGFNVALDLRCRRFSQLRRYRRVNRRSGNFFRFCGRLLIRFRGGDRRGRFFRSHERRGEWGWKSDELLIVLRKPAGGNANGGKKNRARHQRLRPLASLNPVAAPNVSSNVF